MCVYSTLYSVEKKFFFTELGRVWIQLLKANQFGSMLNLAQRLIWLHCLHVHVAHGSCMHYGLSSMSSHVWAYMPSHVWAYMQRFISIKCAYSMFCIIYEKKRSARDGFWTLGTSEGVFTFAIRTCRCRCPKSITQVNLLTLFCGNYKSKLRIKAIFWYIILAVLKYILAVYTF